ncbi:response regulator transcription factor [Allomuricauda sp. d1]|uniref:response regulator transcription factor n=1 Tax=Allomuricauda sp. d1 TaxID=3136725 RepID=UPI0031E0726F
MLTNAVKVMIIDNDVNEHQSYVNYLENQNEFIITKICDGVSSALQDFKEHNPEIILSEVSLNGISGINGIELFKKKSDSAKIILVSHRSDFELIRKAFKMGANGYLTKPLTKERFLNALHSVQSDGAAMSHDVAKKVISIFQEKKFEWFSNRENQIVEYLRQGATYKMIAEKLFVTPSTVNFHIQNIYLKLNVNSKAEALVKLEQLQEFGKAS